MAMNRQQINYIKECLQYRKRSLEDAYCVDGPTPAEIIQAEALIKKYRDGLHLKRSKIRQAINRKIRQLEEQLVLGGIDADLTMVLASLDDWSPVETEVQP
jgi:hypothetical protein